jgi:hypothetical protein
MRTPDDFSEEIRARSVFEMSVRLRSRARKQRLFSNSRSGQTLQNRRGAQRLEV